MAKNTAPRSTLRNNVAKGVPHARTPRRTCENFLTSWSGERRFGLVSTLIMWRVRDFVASSPLRRKSTARILSPARVLQQITKKNVKIQIM
ncbi:hypothetical protein M5D96_002877 [Drosophila gunungcola]|uniref:Uncharacterized protein n=1 Tax=Drosophila gunungcola TaxID=103775 RepID=A0A9P9Z1S4_9MUSC|nr:hypothetical protein M5D96_002877 [Drosophila gunungcola]